MGGRDRNRVSNHNIIATVLLLFVFGLANTKYLKTAFVPLQNLQEREITSKKSNMDFPQTITLKNRLNLQANLMIYEVVRVHLCHEQNICIYDECMRECS